ncbi:hypothetical protein MBLNU230_g3365t1 [Neophaeotheca triangularis]
MIGDIPQVPLSPPISPPRMSDGRTKQHDFQWHPPPLPNRGPMSHQGPPSARIAEHSFQGPGAPEDTSRPTLRPSNSFPYSLGPSNHTQHDTSLPRLAAPPNTVSAERHNVQGSQPTNTSDSHSAAFGGSAPTSPAPRLTSRSETQQHEASGEDEDIDIDDAAEGNEEEGERPPMTAAEIRAQKRKMKRFRLTHNQTRFLMSEFAKQAHPDAAHRERLSREIPGLSPRQVQVWFQNRRAKLKRLTTDDRERMMRSRALPADFDMTQALHGSFGGAPTSAAPVPSSGGYGQLPENSGSVRPLTLDTLRRVPDYEQVGRPSQYHASPAGITPAIGAFGFTPPQSATSTMSSAMSSTLSPASAAGGGPPYDFQQRAAGQESPRRNMYGMGLGNQHQYPQNLGHMARMQAHERLHRPQGETISSPLRSSMSYTGPPQETSAPYQAPNRASSFSEQTSYPSERPQYARSFTNPGGPNTSAYGLGFSYSNVPNYQSNENTPPSTTSAASPQIMDMPQYRRTSGQLAGPPISSHYPYQAQSFATPQAPYYPAFEGAQFGGQDFNSAFQQPATELHRLQQPPRQEHQGQPDYAAMPGQQQFVTLQSSRDNESRPEDDGSSSDGGVPVPSTY